MTYSDKLKDPRWQKRRLEILAMRGWACEHCGDTHQTLHVHHGCYFRGFEPWEYDTSVMHVLCEGCHNEAHAWLEHIHSIVGRHSVADLPDLLRSVLNADEILYARDMDKDAERATA